MSLDFPRTRSEFWEQLGFRTMTAFWLDQYLAIARSHFSHAVLLDTRLIAAGPTTEALSDANIDLAFRSHMPVLGARP